MRGQGEKTTALLVFISLLLASVFVHVSPSNKYLKTRVETVVKEDSLFDSKTVRLGDDDAARFSDPAIFRRTNIRGDVKGDIPNLRILPQVLHSQFTRLVLASSFCLIFNDAAAWLTTSLHVSLLLQDLQCEDKCNGDMNCVSCLENLIDPNGQHLSSLSTPKTYACGLEAYVCQEVRNQFSDDLLLISEKIPQCTRSDAERDMLLCIAENRVLPQHSKVWCYSFMLPYCYSISNVTDVFPITLFFLAMRYQGWYGL